MADERSQDQDQTDELTPEEMGEVAGGIVSKSSLTTDSSKVEGKNVAGPMIPGGDVLGSAIGDGLGGLPDSSEDTGGR